MYKILLSIGILLSSIGLIYSYPNKEDKAPLIQSTYLLQMKNSTLANPRWISYRGSVTEDKSDAIRFLTDDTEGLNNFLNDKTKHIYWTNADIKLISELIPPTWEKNPLESCVDKYPSPWYHKVDGSAKWRHVSYGFIEVRKWPFII